MDGMIQSAPDTLEVPYQGSANFTAEITGTADHLLFKSQWGGLRLLIDGQVHFDADHNSLYNTYEGEPQCYVDMTVTGDFAPSGTEVTGIVEGMLESYMRDGTVVDTKTIQLIITGGGSGAPL